MKSGQKNTVRENFGRRTFWAGDRRLTRVNIIVEGQTEEQFVNELLYSPLIELGVSVRPILVGSRGGLTSYGRARRDILLTLKQDKSAYCSTMFDFFRLPKDFPGVPVDVTLGSSDKAKQIERALGKDIQKEFDNRLNPNRLIPYIQMHEFEALLFSDSKACAESLYRPDLQPNIQAIRDDFPTPEDIDDGPTTSPSKRILGLFDRYQKPLYGCLACLRIGLETLRAECKHFDEWVRSLEALANS